MKIADNMARKFLVLILLALFAIGAHAAQVTHFMASGDFANAFWVGSALPSDASGSIGFNRFNSITIIKN
jgi:hypothetical protein